MTSPVELRKSRQVVGQRATGAPQPQAQPADLRHASLDAAPRVVDLATLTYLRTHEAAEYLRFPSAAAFYKWANRHGVTRFQEGRLCLWGRADLDKAVQPLPHARRAPATRRHASERRRRLTPAAS